MTLAKIILSTSLTFVLAACSDAEFSSVEKPIILCADNCETPLYTEEHRISHTLGAVDILIINDNSPSMAADQKKMSVRFNSFVSGLDGINWQLGIATTDNGQLRTVQGGTENQKIIKYTDPKAEELFKTNIAINDCDSFFGCDTGSSTEEPLASTIEAIQEKDKANAGFFREGANLAVVVLSDEDEKSTGGSKATKPQEVIDAFRASFGSLKKLSVYGIVIEVGDNDCLAEQNKQSKAYEATHVTELSEKTNGLTGSICDDDYSKTLKSIGQSVGSIARSIELEKTPVPETIIISLNPAQEFKWELKGNKIHFDRKLINGTRVLIGYKTQETTEGN